MEVSSNQVYFHHTRCDAPFRISLALKCKIPNHFLLVVVSSLFLGQFLALRMRFSSQSTYCNNLELFPQLFLGVHLGLLLVQLSCFCLLSLLHGNYRKHWNIKLSNFIPPFWNDKILLYILPDTILLVWPKEIVIDC